MDFACICCVHVPSRLNIVFFIRVIFVFVCSNLWIPTFLLLLLLSSSFFLTCSIVLLNFEFLFFVFSKSSLLIRFNFLHFAFISISLLSLSSKCNFFFISCFPLPAGLTDRPIFHLLFFVHLHFNYAKQKKKKQKYKMNGNVCTENFTWASLCHSLSM